MTHYPERNCLANALSPYLLQHSGNPVHWREWGADAFAEARETQKPVLLSIGYAACHWCHVMAHESFEDPAIAAEMNHRFVNIKVDREERPDIDQIYMSALQAMGEQGGWPLTMFLTETGKAFWGGTYFPPVSRFGRPGFPDILRAISDMYAAERGRIEGSADAIGRHLAASTTRGEPARPETKDIDAVSGRLVSALDPIDGGLGGAPKFPSATMWEALWRDWRRNGNEDARSGAITWLRSLCLGGIYDHLGGGLHRYTVERRWLVPHFEKMLYDNAQFVRALAFCHAADGGDLFRERLEETIGFLLTEMRLPEGAFAASYDADSEGEEGRYYVWTKGEIEKLTGADAGLFRASYDVTPEGNWEGRSILNRLGFDGNESADDRERLRTGRQRLLEHRRHRVPPARDDKVLADWNALAIRALAEASQALGRADWLTAATEAFDFVATRMGREGRLGHAWRDGSLSFPGLANDLAQMINAAVALYAATAEKRYLDQASSYAEALETWHGDGAGSYCLAASDRDDVPQRNFNDHDEAIPSATASIIEALARLSLASGDPVYAERAEAALGRAWGRVRDNPFTAVGVLNAADTMLRSGKLVMSETNGSFGKGVRANLDPARIDIHTDEGQAAAEVLAGTDLPPALERNAAYLCDARSCLPPVFDPEALAALLAPGPRTG